MMYGGFLLLIIRVYEFVLKCNRNYIINSKYVYKKVSMCRKKRLLVKLKYIKMINLLWIVRE